MNDLLKLVNLLGYINESGEDILDFTVEIADAACNNIPEILCLPFAGCVNLPLRMVCSIASNTIFQIGYFILAISKKAFTVLDFTYKVLTLGPDEEKNGFYYTEATYKSLKELDKWNFRALETINRNIVTQHSEMREHLQADLS